MSTLTGLVMLLGGVTIGFSLRAQQVWRLQARVDQLRDDLDYLTEQRALRARQQHPAGKTLRVVPGSTA